MPFSFPVPQSPSHDLRRVCVRRMPGRGQHSVDQGGFPVDVGDNSNISKVITCGGLIGHGYTRLKVEM